MLNRGHLLTEQRNPNSTNLDRMSVREILQLINQEDRKIATAVALEIPNIKLAVEAVIKSFQNGGRLFYVGAGTSGRLGVLDAAECPPTFNTPSEMVQGIIAGGYEALVKSVEGAEDDARAGLEVIRGHNINEKDVVIGIAAGATTSFVKGALDQAQMLGAVTVLITCCPTCEALLKADICITPLVGPEILTGSTRMKAGTATKMILNMISTTAMVKIGKVYENLMVDLKATNDKLKDRARRIIMNFVPISYEEAGQYLEASEGNLKVAIVMAKAEVNRPVAEKLLVENGGQVRGAIASAELI